MSESDIKSQILAVVGRFIGTSADATEIHNVICRAILNVPGVASVCAHGNAATGALDATVELTDGQVFTVEITEGITVDIADPVDVLTQELADAIQSESCPMSFSYGTIFRAITVGVARIVHERDERITRLEASIVSEACMRSAADRVQTSILECKIAALEAVVAGLQCQIIANHNEAHVASAMAHAAIHGAAAARQSAQKYSHHQTIPTAGQPHPLTGGFPSSITRLSCQRRPEDQRANTTPKESPP